MIINITDYPKNIKEVIIRFGDNDNEVIVNSDNLSDTKSEKTISQKTDTPSVKSKVKKPKNTKDEKLLDIDDLQDNETSASASEIVEKPIIPDVKRDNKVANSMQNLQI